MALVSSTQKVYHVTCLDFSNHIANSLWFPSGFVHMDIACRNCLLSGSNVIKVADFGLAHKFDDGQRHYRQIGVLKLSIRWLAIDSYDSKIFSEASDVSSDSILIHKTLMFFVCRFGRTPLLCGKSLCMVSSLTRIAACSRF